MIFNTMYDIGDKAWVLYKDNGAVTIFDAEIAGVSVDKDGIEYIIKETCDCYREENVIMAGDSKGLERRVKEMMKEIREEEKCADGE